MRIRKSVFFAAALAGLAAPVEPQSAPEPRLGMIFNANNLLLDLSSYQGGAGAKLRMSPLALRFMFDIFCSNSFSTFSTNLGAALEYHLWPGRVSPYLGAFLQGGVTTQKQSTDQTNWTRTTSVPFSGGAILGAELFVLAFLSVFAEYALAVDLTSTTTRTSTDGDVETTDRTTTFVLDTRLGNGSKIGIVLYLR